jgi:hypothetical protein
MGIPRLAPSLDELAERDGEAITEGANTMCAASLKRSFSMTKPSSDAWAVPLPPFAISFGRLTAAQCPP